MRTYINYICVATDQKVVFSLLDSFYTPLRIEVNELYESLDRYHEEFLASINIDKRFLRPVLLDVEINKRYTDSIECDIYYGVLLPVGLPINISGYSFHNTKEIENFIDLRLVYAIMAKGVLP